MPRTPSAAQIAASRQNGGRSHGPVTPEGKARAAQNARTFGMRSAEITFIAGEDEEHFAMLRDSIHDHFQPQSPLEAALCARMVTALWRSERAEELERTFWCALPPGVKDDDPHAVVQIMTHDDDKRRHSLATVLRYIAEADQAFARALRNLTQLRSGKADPRPDALDHDGTNEPEPAFAVAQPANDPLPAMNCTNEPEPTPANTNEPKPRPAPANPAPSSPPAAHDAMTICTNEPEPVSYPATVTDDEAGTHLPLGTISAA